MTAAQPPTPPTWIEAYRRERRAGTPLIALATPDMPAAARAIALACNGATPCVLWTCSTGASAGNKPGQAALAAMSQAEGGRDASSFTVMSDVLVAARALPERSVLVLGTANRHWAATMAADALLGLRDTFKADGRSLVLLAPDVADLPREVAGDIRILRETLPTLPQRLDIVRQVYGDAASDPANGLPALGDQVAQDAARSTAGLTAFACETAVAVAITKAGLDLRALRSTAREQVNATRGLRMEDPALTFADAAGLDAAEKYIRGLMSGPAKPSIVVLLDEVEKAMAGAGGGDLSGVASDMLGAQLTWMEQRAVTATLLMGPPGAGKSLLAQAVAGTFGIPLVWMDLGAMKGSLVGESGANLRRALDVIDSVAEGRVLLIATCNGVESLRPELMRRFFPRFVVDLPDARTLPAIWDIQERAHGLASGVARPDATGWTGAEVRNACRLARDLATSPAEASAYIVPVSVSSAESIAKVRREATGRFTCARYGGPYKGPDAPVPPQAPPTGPARRSLKLN